MIVRRVLPPLLLGMLVLAAVVRFAGLGTSPLDPAEASRSIAAWWTVDPGGEPLSRLAPRPDSALLHGLDYALFWLLDSAGDTTARLAPALVGTALVALALLLYSSLAGSRSWAAASAIAFLLAFDPWLVAASRRASGAILAAAAAIACHLLWRRLDAATPSAALEAAARRQWVAWSCALGLLVISGTSAWDLLPPVVIAAAIATRGSRLASSPRPAAVSMVAAAAVVALVASTTGLLQWQGPALLSSSLESWLQSWNGSLRESSWATSLGGAGWSVLLQVLALAALAARGLARAWTRGTGSSEEGAGRGQATALFFWLLWGAAMQLRSGAAPDTWLALEVPLLLAASLGLADLLAAVERGGTSRGRVVLAAVAVIVIAGGLAATSGVPRPSASLPAARRLAVDVRALLAPPALDRPRIEVVTGPTIDGVVAWYLREVPLVWVGAADTGNDDTPRVVLVSSTAPRDAEQQPSAAPRYAMSVVGDRVNLIELR